MRLIGRRPDRGEDCRFAQRRRLSSSRIQINELRCGVVIEQILIVRRGEKVFIGRRGTTVAHALLHVRTFRDYHLRRSGPAPTGNGADDQRAIIAHPLNRRTSGLNPVDLEPRDAASLAGRGRSDPEFDAFG